MKDSVNAQFQPAAGAAHIERKLASQRSRLVEAFLAFKGQADKGSVLEVGAAPVSPLQGASWLTAETVPQSPLTHCSIGISRSSPWRCASAEAGRGERTGGRRLPFADGQFDWVFCNALIEHAGSRENQLQLLLELARVAKKGLFLATENRRHPIEFHTGLPLLHWLPEGIWRAQLKLLGKGEWASESILNPLGSDTLKEMVEQVPGRASADIGHVRLGGIKAHFFLMIRKEELPRQ